MRCSGFRVLREALRGHRGWTAVWHNAEPQLAYDYVFVGGGGGGGGGGGHELANAYCLAREFGQPRITVLEKGWIGGGQIDYGRSLRFTFDGVSYQGHPGDTLASALLANGVRLMGRSLKYHRPRGPLSAGPKEPNALVTLGSGARAEPNTRATTAEMFDGMVATSENAWPSLRLDAMAVNDLLSPLLTAGFY